MVRKIRLPFWVLALTICSVPIHSAQAWQGKVVPSEQELLRVLQSSDAPLLDKATACEHLAVVGTSESIPVLAGLLADEQLSHYARFALEPIDDPAVDEAFQTAMDSLDGTLRIGVINSIGNRRNASAIGALSKLARDEDFDVASAAVAALGQMGDQEAGRQLGEIWAAADPEMKQVVADAGFVFADTLIRNGKADRALAIYDLIRVSDAPKHIRLAATYHAVHHRRDDAWQMLTHLLADSDDEMFEIGLQAIRQRRSEQALKTLTKGLEINGPDRAAAILFAIGDTEDPAARPTLVAALDHESKPARIAAIAGLSRLGNASDVSSLMELARGSDEELAAAATRTLQLIDGDGVNDEVIAVFKDGNTNDSLLIELVGFRRISDAVPILKEVANTSDAQTRHGALRALGETVKFDDLEVLIKRVTSPKFDEDIPVAQEALAMACSRMPDRDKSSELLIAAMADASVDARCRLIELLASNGGSAALQAIAAIARGNVDQEVDTSTRVLGEWLTPDVGPVLLDLSQNLDNNKYAIRSLRGYIRIIRQLGISTDEKLEMCREASRIAERDDERTLILEALRRLPSAGALAQMTEYLDRPSLRGQARNLAVAVGEIIVDTEPDAVAQAMAKVKQTSPQGDLARRVDALVEKTSK